MKVWWENSSLPINFLPQNAFRYPALKWESLSPPAKGKITSLEEYGFRCILQIAAQKEDLPLTAVAVAKAEGLSTPYANKLLNILKQAGLVLSVRGVRGGFQLSRSRDEITLADVLKALDSSLFSNEFCKCFPGKKSQCVHYDKSCSLRSVWSVLGEHIEAVLTQTTLGDLVKNKEPMMTNLMRLKFGEESLRISNAR